jgi:hypothetical protein
MFWPPDAGIKPLAPFLPPFSRKRTMKLRRLIQLTASVATAAVLSACGGGGDAGPQWAQDTKATLSATGVKSYTTPCFEQPSSTGGYSEASVLVTFKTANGNYEQVQPTVYKGLGCTAANIAVVRKYPAALVTDDSTFVDPDLSLITKRQTKISPGGDLVVVVVDPTVTVERKTNPNNLADYFEITLPNVAMFQESALFAPRTYRNLAAYQRDTLYWGDTVGIDDDVYPTRLALDPDLIFTSIANTDPNAPSFP